VRDHFFERTRQFNDLSRSFRGTSKSFRYQKSGICHRVLRGQRGQNSETRIMNTFSSVISVLITFDFFACREKLLKKSGDLRRPACGRSRNLIRRMFNAKAQGRKEMPQDRGIALPTFASLRLCAFALNSSKIGLRLWGWDVFKVRSQRGGGRIPPLILPISLGTSREGAKTRRIRWEVLLRLLKYRCLSTGLNLQPHSHASDSSFAPWRLCVSPFPSAGNKKRWQEIMLLAT